MPNPVQSRARLIGFAVGLVAFAASLLVPTPEGLTPEAMRVAGVAALMAAWWIVEVIPVSATALLPVVLFPLLGIASVGGTTAPYADPIVFLFLGGFILGIATQRWELHDASASALSHRSGRRRRGFPPASCWRLPFSACGSATPRRR